MEYPEGVTEKQLEGVIKDFLEHLEASGMWIADEECPEGLSMDFVLDNYFGTFT